MALDCADEFTNKMMILYVTYWDYAHMDVRFW